MADSKLSALAALTGASVDAANDLLYIDDVSVTTSKSITVAQLGVALFNSPTLVTPALGTPASGVLTNCTGTATGLTSGITNALKSATTTVSVSAATAPSSGQVLTATNSTTATWQTPGTSDVGAGGIGMMAFMVIAAGSCNSGSTIAGSSLQYLLCDSAGVPVIGTTASGTWRNISGNNLTSAGTAGGVFQRIS